MNKKREETLKRAREAARKAKEVHEAKLKADEEERKTRGECRTGGGFDMKKALKKKAELEK